MQGTRRLLQWLPAIVVAAGVAIAGAIYSDEIRDWFAGPAGAAAGHAVAPTLSEDPDAIAYWSCSMHPSVRSEGSGICPICSMDLTPVTRGEIETGVITVDAARRQAIGVKTDVARTEPLVKEIRAVGAIEEAEPLVQDITLKFDAWVGEAHADFEGKHVDRGEVLFTFYSPEVWAAQEEYLDAVRRGGEDARNARFADIAENRLRLLGLDAATIASIRQNGSPLEYLPFRAPIAGTVMDKAVVAGSAVKAGERLYRIADLSTVWVEAAVYEDDLAFVDEGHLAYVSVPGLAGESFSGRIEYVYPTVDPRTRTGTVRISLPNPEDQLKPGTWADVEMVVPLGERLVVPESAVLYAGESRVAFVDLGEGRLQPRRVKVGVRSGDLIEIREGLDAGESVVTSGNFLIAAESKLKSGIDQW